MTDTEVAATILEQIQMGQVRNEPQLTKFRIYFKVLKAKNFAVIANGVKFNVSGDKFKGKIVITLNTMDLYDIEFWNVRQNTVTDKAEEINDIYNDQLAQVIWDRVVIV